MRNEEISKTEYIPLILFVFFMAESFIVRRVYDIISPLGTLIMFAGLSLIFIFMLKNDRDNMLKKDAVTAAGLIALIITPLNLFLIQSGKGAMLTVFDLVLMMVIIIRGFRTGDRIKRAIAFFGSVLMLLWYPVIRWDYGFNMVGLMFIILMIFGEILMEYVKNDLSMEYLKYVQPLFFVTSILLAICYQARSAALSMLVFAAVYCLVPFIMKSRPRYNICILFFTAGSLIFTWAYSMLGKTGWNGRLLYKDLLSGRELIWGELWQQFFSHPLTGIGSSYEMKNFFMFEVHNGLFDILVVHGIIVFAAVFFLLIKGLSGLFSRDLIYCPDKRLSFAGLCTLLFASFFENGFITTPYSCVFFVLLLLCA